MALAATQAVAAGRRKAARVAIYAAAALLTIGAIGFALGGLHGILAIRYSPVAASFIIAGGLFALALVLLLFAKLWRPQPSAGEVLTTAALAAAPAARQLITPGAATGAVIAGTVALGAFLGRRVSGR